MSKAEPIVDAISVPEQLQRLTRWVREGRPFLHTRVNDGEFAAMLGTHGEDQTNCDGSHFTPHVRTGLCDTFRMLLNNPPERLIVGSLITGDPAHGGCQGFLKWLTGNVRGWERLPWGPSDLWVWPDGVDEVEMLDLVDAIDEASDVREVVFVGNKNNALLADCLGFPGSYVEVPTVDAWLDIDRILAECREHDDDALFVWCAGFVAKPLSHLLHRESGSSHIDAGHLFDGVFGQPSRDWMRGRQDGDAPGVAERRLKFYNEVLVPYVRGEKKR